MVVDFWKISKMQKTPYFYLFPMFNIYFSTDIVNEAEDNKEEEEEEKKKK